MPDADLGGIVWRFILGFFLVGGANCMSLVLFGVLGKARWRLSLSLFVSTFILWLSGIVLVAYPQRLTATSEVLWGTAARCVWYGWGPIAIAAAGAIGSVIAIVGRRFSM